MSGESRVILGDCKDVLATLDADSVDAVVTDPPAGIGFMGKAWDSFGGRSNANAERDRDAARRTDGKGNQPFGYSGSALPKGTAERDAFVAFLAERLAECLRVAKPGARMLCWAIPRTSHWTATAIEDAGWIVEDRVSHIFGQGFPKAKSKLKPAVEDWWLCRKPSRTVPPLNIDACRIAMSDRDREAATVPQPSGGTGDVYGFKNGEGRNGQLFVPDASGRWPAHLILSHHAGCGDRCREDCPIRMLDEQSGEKGGGFGKRGASTKIYGNGEGFTKATMEEVGYGDSGGASRFFKTFNASESNWFLCRAKSIIEAWKPELANTADDRSTLSSEHVVSALKHAVTLASHGAIRLSGATGLSTSVTPIELRRLSETLIAATLSIASESSPASQPGKPSPSNSRARSAGAIAPTGTITITTSHWKSDGCADAATFDLTPLNSAPGEAGSPSRFIYCPKAPKSDRGEGNTHPTVKHTELMRWLLRLVARPGDLILDPFAGSGSTWKAAELEGMRFLGIESDPEYARIAEDRNRDDVLPMFRVPE